MAGFDPEALNQQMQVAALSLLVTKLMAREFSLSGNPEDMAREWLNLTEIEADDLAIEGVPPEWSDNAAQELCWHKAVWRFHMFCSVST